MGKKLRLLGALLLCSTLVLNGCGGGGSTPGDSNLTSINSGVAVDPYIVGAVFEEFDDADKFIQASAPSTEKGVFIFPANLHKNSKIKLKFGSGLHAGVPFSGNLARNIDIIDGKLVVNPLTTLIAQGMTEAAVLEMLQTITGNTTFTAADLTADPMANLSDGDMTEKDKALLAANMAVNTAVEVLGGNIGNQENLTAVANVVATKLITQVLNSLESKSTGTALNTAAATGITITTYLKDTVVMNTDGTTNVQTVSNDITPEYILKIVVLVENNPTQPVVISDIKSEPVQVVDTTALALLYYTAGQLAYTAGSSTGDTAMLMLAIDKFNAAAALSDSITDAALKDKVLFFGAFAKVLQVAKPMSDGTSNGLNNFGDILDAFGLAGAPAATDRSNLNTLSIDVCTDKSETYGSYTYTWQECDLAPLSDTSPASGELQTFMYAKVGTNLKDAVAMLGQVTDSFSETVNDAGVAVEFDATDAKFISAVANGMLAQINLLQAYNVNVDIDAETNRTTEQTPEQFLAANPNLGKLQDVTRMAAVKTYSNAAIAALKGAIASLKTEGTNQANDFVKLSDTDCIWNGLQFSCTTTYNNATEIADFEAGLLEVETVLNGSSYSVMSDGEDGIPGTTDDTVAAVIDVSKFFAGVDLRSKLPATFNNGAFGDMPGLLPDPAFGGVVKEINGQSPSVLNTDADKDGSPDFFDGMTYFMPGMLTGRTFQTWVDDGTGNWREWRFTFESETTFTGTVSYWLQVSPYSQITEDISGTYTTNKNILTLNMSPAYGPITSIVSTLQGGYSEGDSGFNFETETFGTSGILGTSYNWFSEVQQLVAM